MPYPDSTDVAIEVFGGRNTSLSPANLPAGASPDNQDVDYPEAGVGTRDPLVSFFPAIAGNPTVNGLATFTTQTLVDRLLAWDSLGNFYKENPASINPPSSLQLIYSGGAPGLYMNSTTLFGRQYIGFGFGPSGVDLPRQYDDTNFDRISQCGPGQAPTAQDFQPAPAVLGAPGGGSSAVISSCSANTPKVIVIQEPGRKPPVIEYTVDTVVSFVTATPHGLTQGQSVMINGNSLVPNGTYIALVNGPDTFNIDYTTSPPDQTGTGGTVSVGSVAGISYQRVGNVVTAYTPTPHGFQRGWDVQISGLPMLPVGGLTAISSIARASGIVTVNTAVAHNLVPDATADIVNVSGDTSFNGSFEVLSTPTPTQFTYAQTGLPDSNTATPSTGTVYSEPNGTFPITAIPTPTSFQYTDIGPDVNSTVAATATIVGNVVAGLHNVSVSFITRQGYITRPAPWSQFNAGGGKLVAVSNIPIGPSNITGRLLIFTPVITPPATAGTFYALPSMQMMDNFSTSIVLDFSDSNLISGTTYEYLFTQNELGESNGFSSYNSRLVAIGEENFLQNVNNMEFNGGWNLGGGTGGSDVPLGWTSDPFSGTGGQRAQNGGVWQDAYQITPAGAGMITQTVFQDSLGVAILEAGMSYSVRVTAKQKFKSNDLLTVDIFSPSIGEIGNAIFTPGDSYEILTGLVAIMPAVVPTDVTIRLFAGVSAGNLMIVDRIEIFPTNTPVNNSVARLSYAFNPESFDGTTGQVQIRPGDGQTLRAAFQIRSNLYFAKDNYLAYVTDDGQNEPAFWTVNEVSNKIGIAGPNAWDAGEEWVAFAHRSGLYIFWGSDPVKISQEIESDYTNTGKIVWESVNWEAGWTIWVRIDTKQKKILVGLPVNGASSPNVVMSIDYKFSADETALADSPGATYSAFTGKLLERGGGRKWGLWMIQANSCTLSERPDGTAKFMFGNGVGNGKIYEQVPLETAASVSDDGQAIESFYLTYGTPSEEESQGLQFRSHRKLYDYLTGRAVGAGQLNISVTTPYRTTAIRPIALNLNPVGDFERPLSVHGERAFFAVGTNQVGSWFTLDKFCPLVKADPTMVLRGVSA